MGFKNNRALKRLQPLAAHRALHIDEAGDVAAWSRQDVAPESINR